LGGKRPIQAVQEIKDTIEKVVVSELAPNSRNGSITVDVQFVWMTFSTVSKNWQQILTNSYARDLRLQLAFQLV
jgi:hypothetical protein